MFSLSPRLEVDLDQIQDNYTNIVNLSSGADVSAVLKANAYGMGALAVAQALAAAGCKIFWVARTHEAIALRKALPEATIYVLTGPESDMMDVYGQERLRPVINTGQQLDAWHCYAQAHVVEPLALHVETGMNRLALRQADIQRAHALWEKGELDVALVVSHLAGVEHRVHPENLRQLERFEEVRRLFPSVRGSLGASWTLISQNPAFRQDLLRVGKSLYGLRAMGEDHVITKPPFLLSAPVVQIATLETGESVGYNATWTAEGTRRIATLAIGYGDGLSRNLQTQGEIQFRVDGSIWTAPVVGQVSMDLLNADVTDIPATCVYEGARGYIIDKTHDPRHFSDSSVILSYDAMTRLNDRVERVYTSSRKSAV